jgi:beta-galactosidase
VPQDEAELLTFGRQNRLKMVAVDDSLARVLLLSARSWEKMTHDGPLRKMVENAVNRGQSLILLDIGPHDLGQGYIKGDLGALDGAPRRIKDGYVRGYDLFSGVRVAFHQQAEPESHIQPGATDDSLWMGLPRGSTWIWDRLRAGLIAPAADMDVSGLSPAAFIAEWTGRGAVAKAIADGSYIAYELAGYYAFSAKANDKATIAALRTKVKFLAEDAPALQTL